MDKRISEVTLDLISK